MRNTPEQRREGLRPRIQCPKCRKLVLDIWPVHVGQILRCTCTQCGKSFEFRATPEDGLIDVSRPVEDESSKKVVDSA